MMPNLADHNTIVGGDPVHLHDIALQPTMRQMTQREIRVPQN
jgi:hypothetical protein